MSACDTRRSAKCASHAHACATRNSGHESKVRLIPIKTYTKNTRILNAAARHRMSSSASVPRSLDPCAMHTSTVPAMALSQRQSRFDTPRPARDAAARRGPRPSPEARTRDVVHLHDEATAQRRCMQRREAHPWGRTPGGTEVRRPAGTAT